VVMVKQKPPPIVKQPPIEQSSGTSGKPPQGDENIYNPDPSNPQQEAINLAYTTLTRHHRGGPHSWPDSHDDTKEALAALRPHQTVEDIP
jgi:hypothetical protein